MSLELAANIRIPFKIVITSSVLSDVFKKVFICDSSTNFSNSKKFVFFYLLQVKLYQIFFILTRRILSLIRLMAIPKPNRVTMKAYHLLM